MYKSSYSLYLLIRYTEKNTVSSERKKYKRICAFFRQQLPVRGASDARPLLAAVKILTFRCVGARSLDAPRLRTGPPVV